jgi:hypothetical protein
VETILTVAGAIVVLGGAAAVLIRYVIQPIVRGSRRVVNLLDDFLGEEARDGVDARPGVMARLATIEKATKRSEFHLGNGDPVPLRDIVTQHGEILQMLSKRYLEDDVDGRE